MRTKPQIFLSYAREDLDRVEQLYDRLLDAGFQPWMDKKDILPGERWEHNIWKAVRHSSFFLACLSTKSENKRGFLQKELRSALNIWQEKLDDDIYLIPVRLEDCEVPEILSEFEWVDLFEEKGWSLLLKALYAGMERIGQPNVFHITSGEVQVKTERIIENKETPPMYNIEIEFPQLTGLKEEVEKEINLVIKGYVLDKIHSFRKNYGVLSISEDEWRGSLASELASNLSLVYEVVYLSSNLISLKLDYYLYGAGAAHGQSWTEPLNYKFPPAIPIELSNLFQYGSDYLLRISDYCIRDLIRQAKEDDFEPESMEFAENWIREGASPEYEHFERFNITDKSLIFTFSEYQVGAYVWGIRQVVISYDLLKDIIDNRSPIYPFLQSQTPKPF